MASATALANAAALGPWAASADPRNGMTGRLMTWISIELGTSGNRTMGYMLQSKLVRFSASKVAA